MLLAPEIALNPHIETTATQAEIALTVRFTSRPLVTCHTHPQAAKGPVQFSDFPLPREFIVVISDLSDEAISIIVLIN